MKKLTIDGKNKDIFISDGDKVTLKLLKSNIPMLKIFAKEKFIVDYSNLIKDKLNDDCVFTADKSLLSEIVGFKLHTGVMGLAEVPRYNELFKLDNKIVILNKIIDAENVGAIIRNCVAFGFNSLIIDRETCSPYLRRAVRVSMGAVFNIKIHWTANLINTMVSLKENKYQIFSAEINNYSQNLFNLKKNVRFAIVFGNETNGIDTDVLELSDTILHIPISDSVDSLNVNSATAIFLNYLYNY